ncbi:hypothetical protein PRIC2_004313 [Phytophthora ramorum]
METPTAAAGKASESPSPSMVQVHTAWLAAGANSDVATMRQLRSQFSEWLDLQRQVRTGDSTSRTQRQERFCSWSDFHLRTLGASALHTAAWEGNLEIMQFVLEAGQHPDTRDDDDGMTPMMVAILRLNLMTMRCVFHHGQAVRRNLVVDCRAEEDERVKLVIDVVKLLLRFGADVDAQIQVHRLVVGDSASLTDSTLRSWQDGKTALLCSTSDEAYEVAKCLLDAGASIDAQDQRGRTALHGCVQQGGLLVTNLLLERGANIDLKDVEDISPLTLVLQRVDLNVLQLFVNHHQCVSLPQRLDFGGAVLLQAVDIQSEEVVRFIVENEYASVTARNATGETPLHRAILCRNPALMELLIGLDPTGDSLTTITKDMETPAHYAAKFGSGKEMEMLLQCLVSKLGGLQELGTANPLAFVDKSGMTCLFLAGTSVLGNTENNSAELEAEFRRLEVRDTKVQLLLRHGAPLFPIGFLASKLSPGGSTLLRFRFPVDVQHCLQIWLLEDKTRQNEPEDQEISQNGSGAVSLESLAELCAKWITSVACTNSWTSLLDILVCAGYCHEVVPLLVSLPVQRSALPAFLQQLETFVDQQLYHPLLLQLHDELLVVCDAVMAPRTGQT